MLENKQYDAPKLIINPDVKNFYDFTVDDFKLEGYEFNTIEEKFEVAV
jgi:thymidylate synthase